MRRGSIHFKLVGTVVGAGAAATLALFVGILAHGHNTYRRHLLDELEVQAASVGEAAVAALEFGDPVDAAAVLAALRPSSRVVQAALYTRGGERLAAFEQPGGDGKALPSTAPPPQRSIDDDAVVARALLHRGEAVGTIYVRARTDEIRERLGQQATFLLLLFGFVGSVLGALLLSNLKRTITQPIQELADATCEIRRSGDYSRRALLHGEGELAVLADGFNRMIAVIEERDVQLERQRRMLEQTVAMRTAELAAKSEQLAQAQKMEALGRLAGGVSHDFNNILSVVMADASALAEELAEGEHRAWAHEIVEAGQRGAALTRQLLAFGRKQVLNPRAVDVAETIGSVAKMLNRVLGEHIRLVLEVCPGVRTVFMDPAQLEQALVNLALNARDAMPAGGTLRFEVSDQREHVVLSVSDTGCGMPPEVSSRVFEPFFTTKPQGKGTGLGLAMVHGAVEQSGGHVAVESTPGVGTTFRLYLPPVQRPSEAGDARATLGPAPLGEGESVLLVEDDPQVRAAVRRMLVGARYRVVEASSAEEALARLQVQRVDLVLTDIVMPGSGGIALGRTLAERGITTPVFYMSGYSDEMLSATGAPSPDHVISKPFAREELLRRIRPLLRAPAPWPGRIREVA